MKPKKETKEYKEQEQEAMKEEATKEEILISTKKPKKEEEQTQTIIDLIASQSDIWYKAQVLELLAAIHEQLKGEKDDGMD